MDAAAKAEFLESKGIKTGMFDGPTMPLEAEHVWGWFQDLGAGRGGGFGPAPLSWADIHGYFALHGIEARAWELRVLRVFDAAWFEASGEDET